MFALEGVCVITVNTRTLVKYVGESGLPLTIVRRLPHRPMLAFIRFIFPILSDTFLSRAWVNVILQHIAAPWREDAGIANHFFFFKTNNSKTPFLCEQ